MSALAAEIPVKPKIAATTEMIKNIRAHLSSVMDVPFDRVDRGVYLTRLFPPRSKRKRMLTH